MNPRGPLDARADVTAVLTEVREVHSAQLDSATLDLAVTRAALRDEQEAHTLTRDDLTARTAELADRDAECAQLRDELARFATADEVVDEPGGESG